MTTRGQFRRHGGTGGASVPVPGRFALIVAVMMSLALVAPTANAVVSGRPTETWGTNGRVSAVLPVGDRVYIGGSFSAVVDPAGAQYPAANLAVIDASTGAVDRSWKGSANGAVTALASSGDTLFVAGTFTALNGQARTRMGALAQSTGALITSFKPVPNRGVDALVAAGGAVYASGQFTSVADSTGQHTRPYVAKIDAGTGTVNRSWAPAPNARTRALAVSPDGGRVYLGGDFTSVSGAANTNKTAAVTASDGRVDNGYRSSPTNASSYAQVNELATDGSRLYMAVAGSGGACTAANATTGERVWSKRTNGNLQAVAVAGGTVYCGGHFNGSGSFDGLTRYKLAAVDASSGTTLSFAPRINSALGVWALAADGTRLYSGGDFTQVSGVARLRYAQWRES